MRKYGLFTTNGVAAVTKQPVKKILEDVASGRLVGQKVAGTYVFWADVVVVYHWLNGQWDEKTAKLETLYSINGASQYLGIDSRRIRALAERGDLDHYIIDALGRQGWAMLFAESDLDKVDTSPLMFGPKPRGNEHIEKTADGERYKIIGTHDGKGQPFTYLRLAVARRRAREAYKGELPYKAGDFVAVSLNTKTLRELYEAEALIAVLVGDVTHIDRSIVVDIGGNQHVLTMNALIDHADSIEMNYCGTCKQETVQYWKYVMPAESNICASCRRTLPITPRRDNYGNLPIQTSSRKKKGLASA